MSELTPCPGCRRHVNQVDAQCPFCGASVQAASRTPLVGRHARAAVFAGATLLAAAGCGKKQPVANQGSGNGDGSGSEMAGSSTETAPPDAPAAEPVKQENNVPMPYGAPPARRRVV